MTNYTRSIINDTRAPELVFTLIDVDSITVTGNATVTKTFTHNTTNTFRYPYSKNERIAVTWTRTPDVTPVADGIPIASTTYINELDYPNLNQELYLIVNDDYTYKLNTAYYEEHNMDKPITIDWTTSEMAGLEDVEQIINPITIHTYDLEENSP